MIYTGKTKHTGQRGLLFGKDKQRAKRTQRIWKHVWMTLICVSSPFFYSKLPHYYSRHIQFSPNKPWIIFDHFFFYFVIFVEYSSDSQSLQVAFDVYQPGVNFKKTERGPPHFCITVCRYEHTTVSEIPTNLLERPLTTNPQHQNFPPKTL